MPSRFSQLCRLHDCPQLSSAGLLHLSSSLLDMEVTFQLQTRYHPLKLFPTAFYPYLRLRNASVRQKFSFDPCRGYQTHPNPTLENRASEKLPNRVPTDMTLKISFE